MKIKSWLLQNDLFDYLSCHYAYIMKKPIKKRIFLPILLNILGLRGQGVEIGTWKGDYSVCILSKSRLSLLYSIDLWKKLPKETYNDNCNISQDVFDAAYCQAVMNLELYGKRSQIFKKTSMEAAGAFNDDSLDFVYIDGNHSYVACRQDIELWYPKLNKNGVFAGHDYLDADLSVGEFRVKSAVDDFLKDHPHKLFVTAEIFPSWYFIK